MDIIKELFGKIDGQEVFLFTLKNTNGVIAKITNYGGIVTELWVPDKNEKFGDVVIGFDDLKSYVAGHPYFGCIVGRYANRIVKGKFILNDTEYSLAVRNDGNHLHGGVKGFDKVVWEPKQIKDEDSVSLKLSYLSKDGEEGYPGNLSVMVMYTLTNKNELKINYEATTDKQTILNLTNHSYFNLADDGDVLNHELTINADKYLAVDSNLIPTGELQIVDRTPLDFRKPTLIGARINEVGIGYDNAFVINKKSDDLKFTAIAFEPATKRVMEVWTTEPSVQLYTANHLDGTIKGKGGNTYKKHCAFCLETQHFPDSPNHPEFPSVILNSGQTYYQETIYKFSVKK